MNFFVCFPFNRLPSFGVNYGDGGVGFCCGCQVWDGGSDVGYVAVPLARRESMVQRSCGVCETKELLRFVVVVAVASLE